MALQRFEQRLERLVEGAFAKAFRTGLQPVELGRRLVREMDQRRSLGVRGTIVPNSFTFTLSFEDSQRFAPLEPTLIAELADTARQHARDNGYRFLGMVTVELCTDADVGPGTFRVDATVVEGQLASALVLADGTRVEIGDRPVVVGRSAECDLRLSDPTVSKRHMEVRREGTNVMVIDLGSTNGTRVGDVQVRERVLADGEEIRIGATVLRYEAG